MNNKSSFEKFYKLQFSSDDFLCITETDVNKQRFAKRLFKLNTIKQNKHYCNNPGKMFHI